MLNVQQLNNTKPIKFSLDKYSKSVLTIIAACLILIVANIYFSPKEVKAYDSIQDVNIKSINGSSIGEELPVDLKFVNGRNPDNGLRVDLQYIRGRSIFGDKLPVDIQSINGQFIMGGYLPVTVR